MKKAVILLSGGLDSTTVLAIAKAEGYECYCISFDYGQRHKNELQAAQTIAKHTGVTEHKIAHVDIALFGGSALTDAEISVPKGRDVEHSDEIPATYVPARNLIFLSYATAYAEAIGANDIFIGVNALDYSGYPDCRPEFIESFEVSANLATKVGTTGGRLNVRTPLLEMTKKQIIETGLSLGVDYSQTISCYDISANNQACGLCDACQLRLNAFAKIGLADPVEYKSA
jgi:7-cyano-7-deazaguanine synthase